jgi:hypothetical protein
MQVLVDDSADDIAERIVDSVRFASADRSEHVKLQSLLGHRRRDGEDEREKDRAPEDGAHEGSSHFMTRS